MQTGLHLVTANTCSDHSIVDDGLSPDSDDKKAKNEVIFKYIISESHLIYIYVFFIIFINA